VKILLFSFLLIISGLKILLFLFLLILSGFEIPLFSFLFDYFGASVVSISGDSPSCGFDELLWLGSLRFVVLGVFILFEVGGSPKPGMWGQLMLINDTGQLR
jgi:hypothetical protein